MSELKPCPHHKEAIYPNRASHFDPFYGKWIVEYFCRECHWGVSGLCDTEQEADEEAIEKWNERHKRTCHMVFNNPLTDDNCKCDSCGCTFDLLRGVGWISGRYDYLWSYCANCGAEVVDEWANATAAEVSDE